jgi:hypothetical protein
VSRTPNPKFHALWRDRISRQETSGLGGHKGTRNVPGTVSSSRATNVGHEGAGNRFDLGGAKSHRRSQESAPDTPVIPQPDTLYIPAARHRSTGRSRDAL